MGSQDELWYIVFFFSLIGACSPDLRDRVLLRVVEVNASGAVAIQQGGPLAVLVDEDEDVRAVPRADLGEVEGRERGRHRHGRQGRRRLHGRLDVGRIEAGAPGELPEEGARVALAARIPLVTFSLSWRTLRAIWLVMSLTARNMSWLVAFTRTGTVFFRLPGITNATTSAAYFSSL